MVNGIDSDVERLSASLFALRHGMDEDLIVHAATPIHVRQL